MMTERGVAVDHSTIYRWVQHVAPEMERRLRWQWRWPRSRSWRIDETYVKVRGQWAYLYRALDKLGNTIDFYLSATRNTKAAKRFLGKALNGLKDWEQPEVLNTDKAPTYAAAIAEFKAEGKCPDETRHRQVKYLNNVVEADHGKLKLLLRPVRGFKTLKTAYATIKGFEVMRALRKGQARAFALQGGIIGEARIVERAFGVGPCALTEAMALLQGHLANAESWGDPPFCSTTTRLRQVCNRAVRGAPAQQRIADHRHVRVAVGRDYADAAPTRGTLFGGDEADLEVRVKVVEQGELRAPGERHAGPANLGSVAPASEYEGRSADQ